MNAEQALEVTDLTRGEVAAELVAHGFTMADFEAENPADGDGPDQWRGETVLHWLGY